MIDNSYVSSCHHCRDLITRTNLVEHMRITVFLVHKKQKQKYRRGKGKLQMGEGIPAMSAITRVFAVVTTKEEAKWKTTVLECLAKPSAGWFTSLKAWVAMKNCKDAAYRGMPKRRGWLWETVKSCIDNICWHSAIHLITARESPSSQILLLLSGCKQARPSSLKLHLRNWSLSCERTSI